METDMKTWHNVVVGVDGSEGSRRALAFAAEQARDHRAKLTIVAAWAVPPAAGAPGYGSFPWYGEADLGEVTERQLSEAVDAVLGVDPDLTVERKVVQGHAAPQLIDASSDADLVVVGSRGHGGFVGMVLGSVSQHVTAHAHCPVVVVR
jgi:nucleotide-binding universal stress UspA family protein